LAGTFSALTGGYLVDRVSVKRRGLVPLIFLMLLTGCLAGLSCFSKFYDGEGTKAIVLALSLIGLTAFFLVAPYSFLDGVFTLELAGKRGCAATGSSLFFEKKKKKTLFSNFFL